MILRFFASRTRAYVTNEVIDHEFVLPRVFSDQQTLSEFLENGGEGVRQHTLFGEPFAVRLSEALSWPEVYDHVLAKQAPDEDTIVIEIQAIFSSVPFHYLPCSAEGLRLWTSLAGQGKAWCYRIDRDRVAEPVLLSRQLNLSRFSCLVGAHKSEREGIIFRRVLEQLPNLIDGCEVYAESQGQNFPQLGKSDVLVYFGHSNRDVSEITIQGWNARAFSRWALGQGISLVLLICCEGGVPHLTEETASFVEALTQVGIAVVACHTTPHPEVASDFLLRLVPHLQGKLSVEKLVRIVCDAEAPLGLEAWEPSMFSLFLP